MPVFIAAIGGMLLNMAASIVGRVLLSLGMSVAVYSGFLTAVTFFQVEALKNFKLLPLTVLQLLAVMKVGECISLIVSAMLVRLAIEGMSEGGSIRKRVTK